MIALDIGHSHPRHLVAIESFGPSAHRRKNGHAGVLTAELARALGVSQQTVFAYELGDRRISVLMLVKLAKIFGVRTEDLMGMTNTPRQSRRLSPAGIRHAERFQRLSKTEQRFVKRILDVLLDRKSPT